MRRGGVGGKGRGGRGEREEQERGKGIGSKEAQGYVGKGMRNGGK